MLHTVTAGGSAALFGDPADSGETVGKGLCAAATSSFSDITLSIAVFR